MTCPTCGARLTAAHTNTQRGLAICPTCNTVSSLPEAPPRPVPESLGPRHTLQTEADALVIITRWWDANLRLIPLLTGVWILSAVVWLAIGLSQGDLLITLTSVPHGTIGLGLAYYSLVLWRNQTTTRITPEGLQMTHSPLPLARNVHADAAKLTRVYARQTYHRRADEFSYGVSIQLASGRDEALITGLDKPEAALYLVDDMCRLWGHAPDTLHEDA